MVDHDVNRQTSHATVLGATETAQTTVEPDGHIELILILQFLVSASFWSTKRLGLHGARWSVPVSGAINGSALFRLLVNASFWSEHLLCPSRLLVYASSGAPCSA